MGEGYQGGRGGRGMRTRYNGRHWCIYCDDLTDHERHLGELGKGKCLRCGKRASEQLPDPGKT